MPFGLSVCGKCSNYNLGANFEFFGLFGEYDGATTEWYAQYMMRNSYTASKVQIYVGANTCGATSYGVVRRNAAWLINVAVGAGLTGRFQSGTSGAFSSGQLGNFMVQKGTPGATFRVTCIGCLWESADGAWMMGAYFGDAIWGAVARYMVMIGDTRGAQWGADWWARHVFRYTTTLSNFRVVLSGNGQAGNTVCRIRKNGANGNQSVTIAGGATGAFEDAVNTDSFTPGDYVCWLADMTAAGGNWVHFEAMQVKNSANNQAFTIGCGQNQSTALAAGNNCYYPIDSTLFHSDLTEAPQQMYASETFEVRNALCHCWTNGMAGGSTYVRWRKNGGNIVTLTIPAATTGTFEDTAFSDTLVANDLINLFIQPPGGGGNVGISWASLEAGSPSAPGTKGKTAVMATKMIASKMI